jgi:hypothetical protein
MLPRPPPGTTSRIELIDHERRGVAKPSSSAAAQHVRMELSPASGEPALDSRPVRELARLVQTRAGDLTDLDRERERQ